MQMLLPLSSESCAVISRSDSRPIFRTRWSDEPFRISLECAAVGTDEIDAFPAGPCREHQISLNQLLRKMLQMLYPY
ncbi:Os02g0598350 [Oryza sativa Japonica Group]|uniref:Os02g0598350 protein n=1 Tax=Oryza sativa subsp. japonica TaxID=39947 RepID=A0A0P0VL74_ORYSJ|nr:Os02g0598350 [Oryza sativa Japonica Group]